MTLETLFRFHPVALGQSNQILPEQSLLVMADLGKFGGGVNVANSLHFDKISKLGSEVLDERWVNGAWNRKFKMKVVVYRCRRFWVWHCFLLC